MDTITTYSARRTNVFVWLAVLLSLCSAVTRILYLGVIPAGGFVAWVVYILFPVLANLCVCIRLPYRGSEMFYVTVGPVVLYAVFAVCSASDLLGVELIALNERMSIGCVVLILLLAIIYVATFTGRVSSKLPAVIAFAAPLSLIYFDPALRMLLFAYTARNIAGKIIISDASMYLSVLCMVLSAKRLPPPKEGEKRRLRYGDRHDGYRVHNNGAIYKLIPYFMKSTPDAQNFVADTMDCSACEKFIHDMRKAGCKHFGMNHIFIAAYVRCVAELPDVNRFVAGQKIYAAKNITVSMAVKKEMSKESVETTLKVKFEPTDTALDVYNKFNAVVSSVKSTENTDFDRVTQIVDLVPGILKRLVIDGIKFLDYFNLFPGTILENYSPFHCSMFVTSMGSLGIPPIYHHLYDWGTCPTFCSYGNKYTKYEIDKDGTVRQKKYLDYKFVTDERICDGFYYSLFLKRMRTYILHPERLATPPERIEKARI